MLFLKKYSIFTTNNKILFSSGIMGENKYNFDA